MTFDDDRPILKILLTRPTRRKASVGLFFGRSMRIESATKRAIAFFDGQSLLHNARSTFGYNDPNYDVRQLATVVCGSLGLKLKRVQFYTGVPSPTEKIKGSRLFDIEKPEQRQ